MRLKDACGMQSEVRGLIKITMKEMDCDSITAIEFLASYFNGMKEGYWISEDGL